MCRRRCEIGSPVNVSCGTARHGVACSPALCCSLLSLCSEWQWLKRHEGPSRKTAVVVVHGQPSRCDHPATILMDVSIGVRHNTHAVCRRTRPATDFPNGPAPLDTFGRRPDETFADHLHQGLIPTHVLALIADDDITAFHHFAIAGGARKFEVAVGSPRRLPCVRVCSTDRERI